MNTKIKSRIYNLIREDGEGDIYSNIFDGVIISLIIVNMIFIILDTFNLPSNYQKISHIVEIVSIIIFTIEYIARLWTSDLIYTKQSKLVAGFKFVFSFMAIIDLLAIVPFYLPLIFSADLRVLRILRVFRLFRLLKMNRYTNAFQTIIEVFKRKRNQLISSVFIVIILMLIASILMFNIEHSAQPEIFINAFSGLWWAVSTLTTVGYGDIYPITAAGKLLSGIIALLGIGLVAVPTGIITMGFMEVVNDDKKPKDAKKFCPYCGHDIEH